MATFFEDLSGGRRASFSSHSDFRRGLASRISKSPVADPQPAAPVSHSSTTQGVDFEVPTTLGNTGPLGQAVTAERENRKREFFTHLSGFLSREGSGPVQTIDQWEGLMQAIPVSRDGLEGFIGEITEKFAPESVKREMAERTNLEGEDRLIRGRIAQAEARIRDSGRSDLMVDPGTGQIVEKPPSFEGVGKPALQALPPDAQLAIRDAYLKALTTEGGELIRQQIENEYGNPLVAQAPAEDEADFVSRFERMSLEGREAFLAERPEGTPRGQRAREILERARTGVLETGAGSTDFFGDAGTDRPGQLEGSNATPAAQEAAAAQATTGEPINPQVLARAKRQGLSKQRQISAESKGFRNALKQMQERSGVKMDPVDRQRLDKYASLRHLINKIAKNTDLSKKEAERIWDTLLEQETEATVNAAIEREAREIERRETRSQKRFQREVEKKSGFAANTAELRKLIKP